MVYLSLGHLQLFPVYKTQDSLFRESNIGNLNHGLFRKPNQFRSIISNLFLLPPHNIYAAFWNWSFISCESFLWKKYCLLAPGPKLVLGFTLKDFNTLMPICSGFSDIGWEPPWTYSWMLPIIYTYFPRILNPLTPSFTGFLFWKFLSKTVLYLF